MITFAREIWNNEDKVFARGMLIAFIACILFYIGLIVFAIGDGRYGFIHDDEFNYVAAAKLFSETYAVRAPLCMMEEVSKILGANWYGFSYNIFYGVFYIIFGEHSILFILINALFLILCLALILKSFATSYNKIFAMLMLLLSYPVMVYTFMFFPEILHIFLALIQFMLLYKIYQIYLSKGNYGQPVFMFVVLSLVFSLFRVTSVFWIAGIIPFYKNPKQFINRIVVFIASVVLVMVYMHYFIAPAFVYPMSSIESLKRFQLDTFFKMWIKYAGYNFNTLVSFTIKEPQVFILMFLFLYAVLKSFYKKEKLFLSAVLICLCYFFALISFYNVVPFYFSKQTAVLYPLLIGALTFSSSLSVRKFAILCMLVAFPFNFKSATLEIIKRKNSGVELETKYANQVSELKKISQLVDQDKRNLIEFIHYEYKFPRYIFYEALPLSNKNKYPITYTASLYNESLYPDMDYNDRFVRYKRLKVNYVLSRDSLNIEKLEMIYHSPYYNLYKDNR